MLAGFHPDDMEGDAIESDDEMDDEINEEMFGLQWQTILVTQRNKKKGEHISVTPCKITILPFN